MNEIDGDTMILDTHTNRPYALPLRRARLLLANIDAVRRFVAERGAANRLPDADVRADDELAF